MKKFTESIDETESGHRDSDGNWVPESPQAKLRNKLGSFWTLSSILSNEERLSKLLSTEEGIDIIKRLSKQCEDSKESILDLIKDTEK